MGSFKVALETLELNQNASCEEIKQAYKDLVIVWHPDRFSNNPRLQQKAEEKLKLFNQAYENLKEWQPKQSVSKKTVSSPPPPSVQRQADSSSRRTYRRSSRTKRRPSRPAYSYSSGTGASGHWISLADAEFILHRYKFESLCKKTDQSQRQYQGGPFVLIACDAPPEVMISVPCDSLQMFDRILLSIPCKSMGHFIQQEAKQLLQLLQT